ncbi:hypothetical protein [Parasitella parasitica]|uniref:Uncharacterized protein n=1 Tax=Parasitella parasitica TaxID=35722 RepID=A0A0B7NN11_9FUNG|nr:hypothetical protein [Parasitella parasitica]
MTTNLRKLSLPKGLLSSLDDDTFSKDLLRQFDKKRSKLHFELGFVSQEPSPESSIIATSAAIDYQYEEPIQLDQQDEDEMIMQAQVAPSDSTRQRSTASKRSSSASDLFRRSSAYLRSKLDFIRKNKSHDEYYFKDHTRTPIDVAEKPTKLFMKTTISIPSIINTKPNSTLSSNPPTIMQYPPKPLVYSPIEPITDMNHESKPLLHRISMPLMRVYNHENRSLTRNKSFASLMIRRRKSEPEQQPKRKLKKQ